MIEKVNLRQVLGIAIIGVAVCFMFRACGRASTTTLQADTNETMGTVKAETSIVTLEVERSIASSGKLGEALDGAERAVDGSRAAAQTIEDRIRELERSIKSCQSIAGECSDIIAEVDRANQL